MFVFFFKQKTAYEMRISDWSSDVCSSDLRRRRHQTFNAFRCGLQHKVACGMTMHVIHILEIVQIEHQQRHAFMFTRGALKQRNTCFGNGTAVEKTCQRIGRRQKTCALLGLLALLHFYLKVALTSPAKSEERRVGKAWFSTCRSR